jgi:hypothetical protein
MKFVDLDESYLLMLLVFIKVEVLENKPFWKSAFGIMIFIKVVPNVLIYTHM